MKKHIILVGLLACAASALSINDFENMACMPGGDNDPLPIPERDRHKGADAAMAVMMAVDPNELEGPAGVDSVRWVGMNDRLNYTIYFENDPEFATAHAQKVDVRFDFPDKRLMRDFAVGRYGFANNAFDVPDDNRNMLSTRLDLRDSMSIYVDLAAGIDQTRCQGYWHFSSIDPESGYAPWQVDRGMLPVNDSTHVGEGFVTFSIKPHTDMVTGDTITLRANIVFDSNDTIPTNSWRVTVDAEAPTSRVTATANANDFSHYRLAFNASDDRGGSGLNRVSLYLEDNMGVYQQLAVCSPDSVVDFYVEQGREYRFYSIAEDRAGNREAIKSSPDLILNFNLPPSDLSLSNDTFDDDIEDGGFIARMTSVDSDSDGTFTYALADGEGAADNDLFAVDGDRLLAASSFKCAEQTTYSVRLSTTDNGGLSYSRRFVLSLRHVLPSPPADTLDIKICEGDSYNFFGDSYKRSGTYYRRVSNPYACDSVYVLQLAVLPVPDAPTVTVSSVATLTSSAESGNQWYKDDMPIDGATDRTFTATETGTYHVTASNGICESEPSTRYFIDMTNISSTNIPLDRGWTWITAAPATAMAPDRYFASALADISTVLGSNGQLSGDGSHLEGSIATISPATYKVRSKASSSIVLSEAHADPESVAIPLNTGWNWIPYLPTVATDLDIALANLNPHEGDVIKSHTEFAMYSLGAWTGTLQHLQPYAGYMYNTTSPATLRWSPSRVQRVSSTVKSSASEDILRIDATDYADNMTIVAQVYTDNDTPAIDGAYTIVAYCGDTPRGTGTYIDGRLYMVVHGSANDNITFAAYSNATSDRLSIAETLSFDDLQHGSPTQPMRLTISDRSAASDIVTGDITIYPNPVRDTAHLAGDLTHVSEVKIISASGVTVISTSNRRDGIDMSTHPDGVYIAAVIYDNGTVSYHKFIKRSR
jgi:hypothetical protein